MPHPWKTEDASESELGRRGGRRTYTSFNKILMRMSSRESLASYMTGK